MKKNEPKLDTATFAAGCFWGVEELFRTTHGVKETIAGYSGGWVKKPSYTLVCTSATGHAEAVQVKFDPKTVSYKKLLKIFFDNHDPTTKNRQGLDIGSQYRSAIFFHDEGQKKDAGEMIEKLNKEKFNGKIVTELKPAQEFFAAEEYHQKYLQKKGLKSCHI